MSESNQERAQASLNEAFRKLAEAAAETGRAIAEAIIKAFEPLAPVIKAILNGENLAMLWASNTHPEWVAIYERTKKARIRKKYRDRIMRAYRAECEKVKAAKEVHTHE